MRGYHYTTFGPIAVGQIIRSNQHLGQTHRTVWAAYKEVADELALFFPQQYGYAYADHRPHYQKDGSNDLNTWTELIVQAPDDRITRGNLNHSVFVSMENLRNYTDRSIPDLAKRMARRHELLKEQAAFYFTDLSDETLVELISDSWVVVS